MISASDAKLIAAFGKLPKRTRTIFWLVNSEGYKYEEAARELGMNAKTVRKHLLRAYDMLGSLKP